MNSIDWIAGLRVDFERPLLWLLLVPALILAVWPYFRLPGQHRRTRGRVVSLVLHAVILTLCAALVTGTTFRTEKVAIKNDVVILVDMSASNARAKDKMDAFVRSALDESGAKYNIGVVTFAEGQIFAADPSRDPDKVWRSYVSETKLPAASATDIEAALKFAAERIDKRSGRIVLLSDGRETDGNALALTKTLAREGTRIDAVFFTPSVYEAEVQISAVAVPESAAVGQPVHIPVTLKSASAGRVTVALYDNGEPVASEIVALSGGTTVHTFSHTFTAPKLHELVVRLYAPDGGPLAPSDDAIGENNAYHAFVDIEVLSKVLILEGADGEAASLAPLLDERYNVETRGIADAPSTLDELTGYDEVVLLNVSNASLPAGFDGLLETYVSELGGGLFTAGGGNAYRESDMKDSAFERLLPVRSVTDAKSLALVLVIDTSSSMLEAVGSKTRLDLAKAGAEASINVLRPNDYIGIITFNSSVSTLQPIIPVTRKQEAIDKVSRLTTGVGTGYYNAVARLKTVLNSFTETELKHVIFLTDGHTTDGKIDQTLSAIRTFGQSTTLSAIRFGDEGAEFAKNAEDMAKAGRGRYYSVDDPTDLPAIMREETKVASSEYLNDKPFTPEIRLSSSPVMQGVSALPEMGGYYGTTAKEGAEVVLVKETDPLYAEWTFGKGRVGSFMSDLSGHWSDKLLADEQGKAFLFNVVRRLFPPVPLRAGDVTAAFAEKNYTTDVRITASSMGDGETLTATLTPPDGQTTELTLTRAGDSYTASFRVREPGIYAVTVAKRKGGRIVSETTAYKAFSYSAEYDAFADNTDCLAYLDSLTKSGGGKMLFTAEGMFGKKAELITRRYDPRTAFLILAVCLFLLDIVARKFKFKWPHELMRERREKKNNAQIE